MVYCICLFVGFLLWVQIIYCVFYLHRLPPIGSRSAPDVIVVIVVEDWAFWVFAIFVGHDQLARCLLDNCLHNLDWVSGTGNQVELNWLGQGKTKTSYIPWQSTLGLISLVQVNQDSWYLRNINHFNNAVIIVDRFSIPSR